MSLQKIILEYEVEYPDDMISDQSILRMAEQVVEQLRQNNRLTSPFQVSIDISKISSARQMSCDPETDRYPVHVYTEWILSPKGKRNLKSQLLEEVSRQFNLLVDQLPVDEKALEKFGPLKRKLGT